MPSNTTFSTLVGRLALSLASAVAPATAATSTWRVAESESPLTGVRTISASLASTAPLNNQIDVPEPASLVVRCDGTALAAYINWPQVLQVGANHELYGTPQTLVLWRLDDTPIRANFWDISDDYSAAGKFTTGGAIKILGALTLSRKLVVRMTGRVSQDAVFDLGEAQPVVAQIQQACGVAPRAKR